MNRPTAQNHTIATATTAVAFDCVPCDHVSVHVKHLLERSCDLECGPVRLEQQQQGVTRDILAAVLDVLAVPVVLCDRRLSIVHANRAAARALSAEGPIWSRNGHLTTTASEQPKLNHAVGLAVLGCGKSRPLVIEAATGARAGVWVQPLDEMLQTTAPVWAQGLAAVIIKPMRCGQAARTSLLRTHYRLTPKQAEVVARLAAGARLDEVALAMRIGLTTARSHLAQCFAKTGTNRQSDLVCLALALQSPILE